MSDIKERAIAMILKIPDDSMTCVIGFLQSLEASSERQDRKNNHMEAFFSAAGKVQVDADAVSELRRNSMI